MCEVQMSHFLRCLTYIAFIILRVLLFQRCRKLTLYHRYSLVDVVHGLREAPSDEIVLHCIDDFHVVFFRSVEIVDAVKVFLNELAFAAS